MSEMIDLTTADLGVENLGEMWEDFIARCLPDHATLFTESYNLIAISVPESFVDSTLTHLLIDEGIDTSDLMSHVRKLFIDSIIDCLQLMGIIIDNDYVEMNSLQELKVILDTIYLVDGMTDLIGLLDILNDSELTPKERFISVIRTAQPQYDMENAENLIKDVSTNVIRGIMIGINVIDEDDTEWVDPSLQTRIKANKEFLKGSLANKHITDGGGVGLTMDSYLNLFTSELGMILMDGTQTYLSSVLSLMLISSLTDAQIVGQYNSLVEDQCNNIEEIYKAQEFLKGVVLDA